VNSCERSGVSSSPAEVPAIVERLRTRSHARNLVINPVPNPFFAFTSPSLIAR
jgi:hypothetical protein